jgi:hypothetical protein
MLGVPHAWPSPDPIVQDLKTCEVSRVIFGEDRVATLRWRLAKRGLRRG